MRYKEEDIKLIEYAGFKVKNLFITGYGYPAREDSRKYFEAIIERIRTAQHN